MAKLLSLVFAPHTLRSGKRLPREFLHISAVFNEMNKFRSAGRQIRRENVPDVVINAANWL